MPSHSRSTVPSPYLTQVQREQFIQDGFVQVSGLIPEEVVATTREKLLAALAIDPQDPQTWAGKNLSSDHAVIQITTPCRTPAVELVAEELVGPYFLPEYCHSPYLESRGVTPAIMRGYIPVLNFPTPGPKVFEKPAHYHIDGMHLTTLWPGKFFLVVFAYLTDTAEYGGATTVLPGSHRQVFTHWAQQNHPGSTHPPTDLAYAEPMPLPGRAGDVLFLHYLLVHSGSANHSDHIRVGLNTAVMPDPEHPYRRKSGPPQPDWTPLDWTLRTDNLETA